MITYKNERRVMNIKSYIHDVSIVCDLFKPRIEHEIVDITSIKNLLKGLLVYRQSSLF